MRQANDVKEALPGRQPSVNFCYLCFCMHLIIWNLLYNMYIGVYQPIFECRDKGFNFLEKGLKNDLETYFEKKNSPFAKLRPRA